MMKYISLIGGILLLFVFGITIKTTFANPSGSNLIISGLLFLFGVIGLYLFFRKPKSQKGRVTLPIERD